MVVPVSEPLSAYRIEVLRYAEGHSELVCEETRDSQAADLTTAIAEAKALYRKLSQEKPTRAHSFRVSENGLIVHDATEEELR